MLQKTLKQGVGKWCPSTTGPLLPTMTDSLLAPGRGCHFCPCQEKPQARGARSAFPHEAGPQQGLLLGKVLSGSLQRIVLCMGWVSRAQGCVTAGSQHCRAQRTLCPTNTTRSNRIFCVHNYSLDTGGGYFWFGARVAPVAHLQHRRHAKVPPPPLLVTPPPMYKLRVQSPKSIRSLRLL